MILRSLEREHAYIKASNMSHQANMDMEINHVPSDEVRETKLEPLIFADSTQKCIIFVIITVVAILIFELIIYPDNITTISKIIH